MRPPPLEPTEPAPALGWLYRLGYLFAGMLVVGLILAHFNPSFGFFHEARGATARLWPWEMFRDESGPNVAWLPAHVWLITFTLASVCLLMAAALPSGRLRGGLGLTAAILVGTAMVGSPPPKPIGTGINVALAVLAAGAWAGSRTGASLAARRTTWTGWIAMVVLMLLPVSGVKTEDGSAPEYHSIVRGILDQLSKLASGATPAALDPATRTYDPSTLVGVILGSLQAYAWLLAALLGALAVALPGRRWIAWGIGFALLLAIVGQPIQLALDRVAGEREYARGSPSGTLDDATATLAAARGAAEAVTVGLRSILLPLALALADLLCAARRRDPVTSS